MKRLAICLVFCLLPLLGSTAKADTNQETISSFNAQATITPNNVVQVQEKIIYNFGSNSRHGIYRDIPVEYHDGTSTYYTTVMVGQVRQDGASARAQTSQSSGNVRLKIGDGNVTISGQHTYDIRYDITPLVYRYQQQPFLNFDAIGTGWEVPIQQATVSVHLANGASFSNARCYYGGQGSSTSCDALMQPTADTIQASETNLGVHQGITINANLPQSYLTTYLQANKKPSTSLKQKLAGSLFAICFTAIWVGVLAIILVTIVRRQRAARKRSQQTVVAQYEPPIGLTPAEIGLLEDDSSAMAEITATIIDLAVRGYLKIIQLEQPSGISRLYKKQDYQIMVLKPLTDLPTEEAALINGITDNQSAITVSKINKTSAAAAISVFKAGLKNSLTQKGYYAAQGGLLSRGNLTDAGAAEWATVDGFKLYLSVTEKDRLKFSDAPARTPERFSALLPYAIALGVEKDWAKQFAGIDLAPSTGWYAGNTISAFTASGLTDTLSSSFQSSFSSNTAMSSGGGMSGGGGGGGGGGSW